MSSAFDDFVLSSSPTSFNDISPLGRRETLNQNDENDVAASVRPRPSPVIIHSYDLDDPDVRERQRTMDVDMAINLSRVRRESMSLAPSTSPFDLQHERPFGITSPFVSQEQHYLEVPKEEELRGVGDIDNGYTPDRSPIFPRRKSSVVDLHGNMAQTHDPSLPASLGHPLTVNEDPSASIIGLQGYQSNVSRHDFDFAHMEEFAADEKMRLGIDSHTPAFSASSLRLSTATKPNTASLSPVEEASESSIIIPRLPPHRKLSQNNLAPRVHRKSLGGKMALFEGRLGSQTPSNNTLRPGDGSMPDMNTGHDRPYRFSFYSNALSATIHARSLCELPADGQTFRDLFTSVQSDPTTPPSQEPPRTTPPLKSYFAPYDPVKRHSDVEVLAANGDGQKRSNVNSSNVTFSNDRMNAQTSDEGTTWWLDVQSPTDEEMKMLSKVCLLYFNSGSRS